MGTMAMTRLGQGTKVIGGIERPQRMIKLEQQVEQISAALNQRQKGTLPSDTIPNPRNEAGATTCRPISCSKTYDTQQHWRSGHCIVQGRSQQKKSRVGGEGSEFFNPRFKGSRRANEEDHDDVSLPQQPLRHFGICWVTDQEAATAQHRLSLSEHSRALCRVGPGFEEPLDDDVATDEEIARVESYIESDDDDEDYEMGEAALSPTNDED
ncbi:hypothetical protein HAX54_010202 [Datura stramonium]|uniref:Uncharacterized protein n=1 Tax=Datura stramonium TaxID=4076 RepID=A0ABS8TFV8_DATST|nr:hypothetical protein [Datura stramonium]